MLRGEFFARVVRTVVRRPLIAIATVAVLAVAGAALTLSLEPSTDIGTLVDRDSDSFQATEAAKQDFGDDPVIILVKGDLQQTLLTPDLGRLRDLETCLAGDPAAAAIAQAPPVCRELADLAPARVVYGPGTFIGRAADELLANLDSRLAQRDQEADLQAENARKLARKRGLPEADQQRLADAARSLVEDRFAQELANLALRFNITSPPALNNPQFVSQLVFDTSRGVSEPKARFSYLFPSSRAAVVQVRLRPDLTQAERERAIDLIGEATASERFAPQRGGEFVVTGVPVVVDALAGKVQSQLYVLLLAALVVMAGTLALVFRSSLRLLPLGLALAAGAITFGAVAAVGGSLTMASIAALPVLIGLAVDYAIQFQSRFNERREIDPGASAEQASEAAAIAGAPTIVSAGLATVTGFLVLLLSPVPMVRGFGAILVVGVAIALACALTAGFAALVRLNSRGGRPAGVPAALPGLRGHLARIRGRLRTSAPGRTLVERSCSRTSDSIEPVRFRLATWWRVAFDHALAQPRRVLAIGLALAVLGWAADTQLEVVSDVRELVPQDLPALQDLDSLQELSGVSGEVDVTVRSDRLTDPEVLAWMKEFQERVLSANGYADGEGCRAGDAAADLCPALSLPDLLGTGEIGSADDVEALLDAVPPYFLQAVISDDRDTANLAFGIPLMPLDRQYEVIKSIRDEIDPPAGVDATVTGLPVLAAEGNAALSDPLRRFLVLIAGLVGVFVVLLVVRRRLVEAVVPLIPIALATGWATLILFVIRIPLNPMSAALGVVVIAISTEFSVLLSSRYREERDRGAPPRVAVERAYVSTGAAVLASGVTATAGFAVLIASDIRMLRDFGAVTVVGLGVSLLGVMLILPAALIWAEAREKFELRAIDPRRLRPRLRRSRG